MIFFLSIVIFLSLYFIGNAISKNFNLNLVEKPIFAVGFIIIYLNYFYFLFNISIIYLFYILCMIIALSIIYTLITNKKIFNQLKKLSYYIFIIIILFQILFSIYGEQHYVFRGNQQDAFTYLSTGLLFFKNTYTEILNLPPIDSQQFYEKHVSEITNYRPSVGLLLATLNNIKFVDIFVIGFVFKIICTLLTLMSCLSLFAIFEKRESYNLILSYCFILSLFYFYNFEIDALSLILSLPFLILIIKYSTELINNILKFNWIFFLKYIFLWACFFIIYPNGGAIIMPPITVLIIYYLIKNKLNFSTYKNLFFCIIIFLLIIAPTYKSSIIYLHQEIIVGLFHDPDFWGYYGAFIFGKDNPIHDLETVSQIKEMWLNNTSVYELFKSIININIEKGNNFFYLNIIPSTLGFFHFSTSSKYGSLNILLILILIFLNFILIKRLIFNSIYVFINKNSLSLIIRIFLIYFILFFLFLIWKLNFWSAIKLYFILSPIFFILVVFNFSKKSIKPIYNFILILLMLLPFYKYSEFNYGIGKLDSFPSIIKKKNKVMVNWKIDREKLSKCKNLEYDIDDRYKKIYISLIFDSINKKNDILNCRINENNKMFDIKIL